MEIDCSIRLLKIIDPGFILVFKNMLVVLTMHVACILGNC